MTTLLLQQGPLAGSAPTTESKVEAERLREAWLAEEESVRSQSFWKETGRRFLSNKVGGVSAAGVVLLLVLAAIFAPLITSYDPLVGNPADRLLGGVFSGGHVLGTDEQGRDMFARIVYGGRLSLVAGFVPTSSRH